MTENGICIAVRPSFDDVARGFGDFVWPELVRHRFFHRLSRPDRYQLRLYRRCLELNGRVKPSQKRMPAKGRPVLVGVLKR